MKGKWWMEGVGYQIFPKTFYDDNDDGIGDIRGITKKLDYIKDLGVDFIWICPFNRSPMDDNGYDVSDFYDVNEIFGTLEDVKKLIEKAHEKNIRIIMDLVLNHTSDEHTWFAESRKDKSNKYRDYYIWRQGKDDGPPNNWGSFFGGSAWKKDDISGEYYMKIFSDKMPDLNWENTDMQKDMYRMINWWIDLGIDGFRVDAVSHLDRDRTFDDSKKSKKDETVLDISKFTNLPKVHTYLKKMSDEIFRKRDVMTVGEVGGSPSGEDMLKYVGFESKEMDMAFTFDHMWCFDGDTRRTNLIDLKRIFKRYQEGLFGKGWNALYWENHDQMRVVSKYGDVGKHHNESAKMLCLCLYFMWGTPFIYNGQEIGMCNYPFKRIEEFDDVAVHTRYEVAKAQGREAEFLSQQAFCSRDNSRTAMQWSVGENAGFTTFKTDVPINPNFKDINVEQQQKDRDSILNFYKKVIWLKKKSDYKDVLTYGKFEMLFEDDEYVFCYIRELDGRKILVIANYFEDETVLDLCGIDIGRKIVSNYDDVAFEDGKLTLRSFEAMAYEVI